MKIKIDMDALLAPIPGENPAGEDLRYNSVYDALKEARRADDQLERGEWQREIKTSDWDKVLSLALEALSKKSKDLQIAAWLTEALIRKEGFGGLAAGLRLVHGLLQGYWEKLYPAVEEEDLDFRAAPLQFMNDKLSPILKEVPLTDPAATPGYSWLKWAESREAGSEADTLSRSGSVDESRKKRRDDLIAEGKLTAEEFASAVARTPKSFSQSLAENLALCRESFKQLDQLIDEKFGPQAPRLSDFGAALEDCAQAAMKIYPALKGGSPTAAKPTAEAKSPAEKDASPEAGETQGPVTISPAVIEASDSSEKAVWEEALQVMKASGMRDALARILAAANSASSVRARSRYRLLMAKLCLEADRPDLARPIVEGLNHLIEELHLEAWESPLWIAEVLDALYQCLIRGEPSEEDRTRGKALLQKLCTMDVTRAMTYTP
jgi:type VI secretion system protein ImpA